MKTKLIIFILIILIILGVTPLTYSATEDNVMLTTSASTVNVGDTVTITLTFSQKVQAADFKIKFSSDILKFKSTLSSLTLDEDYTVRDGEIQYCLAKNSGIESIPIIFEVVKAENVNVSTDIENLNIDTNTKLAWSNKTVSLISNRKNETQKPSKQEEENVKPNQENTEKFPTKELEKEINVSNKDNTIAKDPIPQTGENYTIIGISLIIIGIGVVAIIKYRRYRDIL